MQPCIASAAEACNQGGNRTFESSGVVGESHGAEPDAARGGQDLLGAKRCGPREPRAEARQPPRPRHGCHRHRQDRVAAGDGGGLRRRRRARFRRRHQGRPLGHLRHGRAQGFSRQACQGHRPGGLVQHVVSDDVLGPVRRAGPPDPRHRAGDGPAAAVAADGAQRDAGGRAQHHLPRGGRREHAAARPQGFALARQRRRPARQVAHYPVRQRLGRLGGRHPAPPAGAGGAGRQQLLRRAGARHHRLHQDGARRPRR